MADPARHSVWADFKNISAKIEELEYIESKLSGDVYELKTDIENKIEIMKNMGYIDNELLLTLKG